MTCIVGLVDNGNVYLGGDSAGVAGLSISIRADEKVFVNGPFIMGFTTSFRMGQLLRYKFSAPVQQTNQTDMSYMVTDFVDAVKKTFANNGFGKLHERENNEGGTFLVGYNGVLYSIQEDFQVGVSTLQYDAVGCGSDLALGSLYSSKDKKPMDRIKLALEAATQFNAGVAEPFNFVSQINKDTNGKTKRKQK